MIKILYQKLLKPLLFRFHPDLVHKIFIKLGIIVGRFAPLQFFLRLIYGRPSGRGTLVDGIHYQGHVLLAAGFDYNAHIPHALYSIGFAGEEVGSVTAKPCAGNAPPNLKRLIRSQSIQVYKGLRNDGVEKVIERIRRNPPPAGFIQGISIARTNSPDCASMEAGIVDYVYSYRRLNEENIGAFYTINISCPNAFGGEDFARPKELTLLLEGLKSVPSLKPLYFKMPINKDWRDFSALLDVLSSFKVNGVVIGNLNKQYNEIDFPEELSGAEFRGGLSGKPCRERSTALIRQTRAHAPEMTIIGCGGILSVEDAKEKLLAGANLLQMISGMIFNGPHLLNEINQTVGKMGESKQIY